MGKIFNIKPRINKANGQINFSIPRKECDLNFLNKIMLGKKLRIKIK